MMEPCVRKRTIGQELPGCLKSWGLPAVLATPVDHCGRPIGWESVGGPVRAAHPCSLSTEGFRTGDQRVILKGIGPSVSSCALNRPTKVEDTRRVAGLHVYGRLKGK